MNPVPESAIKVIKFFKARLGILEERYTQHRAKKRLRIRETVSLGDKRFIAVVEYRHQEVLVAGTSSSITVLMTGSPLDGTNPAVYESLTKDRLQ